MNPQVPEEVLPDTRDLSGLNAAGSGEPQGPSTAEGFQRQSRQLDLIVPLKSIEYGAYGDLIIIYPKPCSIYLRGTLRVGCWTMLSSICSTDFLDTGERGPKN